MPSSRTSEARKVRNLLGDARAEGDRPLLSQAFVKTADYHALASTRDYNFVVGRRGTGKTALYLKVAESFSENQVPFIHSIKPEEHDLLTLLTALSPLGSDYRTVRATARVIWRAALLTSALADLNGYWKLRKYSGQDSIIDRFRAQQSLVRQSLLVRCASLARQHVSADGNPLAVPGTIAQALDLEGVQRAVQEGLRAVGRSVVFLFDGLDEGWDPSQAATAIIGGLAIAVSDLRETGSEIHGVLFLRDNIFRALSSYDPDTSRHIEGSTLRLHWDESSLLNLVANRIRVTHSLEAVESDIKVWNRFAQRDLVGMDGFKVCLHNTLYRPRDILVLLNQALSLAARSGRDSVIETDVYAIAKQISIDRLADLLKEYAAVFPGLALFVRSFQRQPGMLRYGAVIQLLDETVAQDQYRESGASDLALLGTGTEVFRALYSVGFVGVEDAGTGALVFCHDGGRSAADGITLERRVAVHPCYWKALDMDAAVLPQELLIDVHDDYEVRRNPEARTLRIQMVGRLVADLPPIPLGQDGAATFEAWVFRAVRILFSGRLVNPELKPNQVAVQRRDIVATNMATEGFWRRIREDYQSRQSLIEVKNYAELRRDDFRQVLSYSGQDYGRFAIIVNRSETEGLGEGERDWIREMHAQHGRVMMVLPASVISRCIRKLRSSDRHDYTEDVLTKLLDTYVRRYIPLQSGTRGAKGKRGT